MTTYLLAMVVIGLVLLGWVSVEQFARLFAARHPDIGPYHEAGRGCGGRCSCRGQGCEHNPGAGIGPGNRAGEMR